MENQATMSDFDSILASRGVTRRSFMKLCARHRRRSRALPARGSARGASSGRVCYRRDVRQPVSGHLDRGCFLHRLHGVLRPGGDSRCRIGRARHDLPELLGDPVGRRWPLHGGGQGPDHRRQATTFSSTRAPCSRPSTATLCAWPARPASRPLWRLPSRPTPLWRSAPAP